MKLCAWCNLEKPHSEFNPDKRRKDGLRNECKACRSEYNKKWYTSKSKHHIVRQYGISVADYARLREAQDNKCAICGLEFAEIDDETPALRACVDHDHTTGKVRGLLHANCNAGLGMFMDSPDVLEAAAAYLRAA